MGSMEMSAIVIVAAALIGIGVYRYRVMKATQLRESEKRHSGDDGKHVEL